jgi:ATP-dependent exoDNAse (exonuclease V) alpha subunit
LSVNDARTIHRLLEADPRTGRFKRGEETPLDWDLLVVDEVSMVDVPLMRALLRAMPDRATLLLSLALCCRPQPPSIAIVISNAAPVLRSDG